MKLYELLEHNVNRKRIHESKEYAYFLEHSAVLENYPMFSHYLKVEDPFTLIQANIIIQGVINKLAVENIIREEHDKIAIRMEKLSEKLPNFRYTGLRIYIPFMLPNHNNIYFKMPEKLLSFPYSQFVDDFSDSIIDCFDFYNYKLYESDFTSLIYIAEDDTTRAYYHPSLEILFIINDQGRVDASIYLFDRHMKDIDTENIVKRLTNVVEYYYAGDKIGFIDALFSNNLISEKLYRRIYKTLKIIKK